MDVYRITEEGKGEYQWIPHSAIDNRNLSLDAVGLLGRLLSDGERFESVRDLADHEGRGDADIAESAARELEAAGYMRFGERIEVWAVPFGWQAADKLTADGRALLAAFAAAPAPMGMVEARDAVLPGPTGRDGRSREHRLWVERANEVADAWTRLWEAGLIWEVVPANGEHGSKCEITNIGRLALAGGGQ